jgi:hypothetical protein
LAGFQRKSRKVSVKLSVFSGERQNSYSILFNPPTLPVRAGSLIDNLSRCMKNMKAPLRLFQGAAAGGFLSDPIFSHQLQRTRPMRLLCWHFSVARALGCIWNSLIDLFQQFSGFG